MDGKEVVAVHKPWDDDWGPDIVVGVDFGMTCTGVAYSIGPEWLPPRTIQRWPGKLISELANKVPTAIEYESPSHSVKSWGFLCNTEDPASDIKEYFKLHLAPGAHQGGKITRAEAQRWLQDYIRCVCQHVTAHFRDTLPSFAACKVEWVFSVPTTWKDVRMVEETRHLLQRAINMSSPGMSPENNRAVVGLTEAEAAAVDDLQQCFDAKIAEMFDLLDGQIRHMHDRFATERISCLILSGGFGSSPYVRKRLMERYGSEIGNGHGNTTAMRILMAEEPQLAAVHGLVLDRIQLLKQGVLTFGSRCSPVSYGIICDQLYIPEKHAGELIRQDPHDQLSYAIDQIDWLVVQGSPVPPTGFSKEFQLKLEPGREVETFQVHIVMSHYPPALLPKSMSHKGVERVCTLHISTEGVDKKLKNRHWYNRKPVFWKGTFSVKVVVGPADLAFQLWSKDQRIRSSSHPPIALKWMSAGV
ncbi:hypothetical protein KXX32_001734 [Aspergillus fumigatus]|uniref:Hsp70 family chaperone n=1 Tax=Aspergillus fumigatus TaxID=746128 RepID=A0A9P8SPX5_ASPFM|nr:hypothetical protein KXX32_001734 [Aspergillus fumigatus]KAH1896424.1 hypothetical protein KXV57_001344 [Aspergillus fumigatus]